MQNIIDQLNQTNPEASYSANGNIITGTWNRSAQATGAIGQDSMHMDYSVVVTLNADNTYSYTEKMNSSNTSAGPGANAMGPSANPFADQDQTQSGDGISVFSSSSETFSGKTFGNVQKGFTLEFGGKKGANSYSYSFDASKIKDPLLKALQAAGYAEQKKSFFKGLFGK